MAFALVYVFVPSTWKSGGAKASATGCSIKNKYPAVALKSSKWVMVFDMGEGIKWHPTPLRYWVQPRPIFNKLVRQNNRCKRLWFKPFSLMNVAILLTATPCAK